MPSLHIILKRLRRALMPYRAAAVAQEDVTGDDSSALNDNRWLREIAEWCVTGRMAEAELELHQWHRDHACPAGARVMLAALLAKRGALDHALTTLHRAATEIADEEPEVIQEWIAVLISADLLDAASRISQQLHRDHGHDPAITHWLRVMAVPGCDDLPAVPDAAVEHLAMELVEQPRIIATLVAAQKINSDDNQITMLRAAIGRAARDLVDPTEQLLICQAMADLALIAHDHDDARRWAFRGLKLQPYSATLALVLSKISDDPAVGPAATHALSNAVEKYPNYPDLRIALIRRTLDEGRGDEAWAQLKNWLEAQPEQPIARRLADEMRSAA